MINLFPDNSNTPKPTPSPTTSTSTPNKTSTPKKGINLFPDSPAPSSSAPSPNKAPTASSTPTRKFVGPVPKDQFVPPDVSAPLLSTLKQVAPINGHPSFQTPSGTIWEYPPDNTKVIHLGQQFGGGVYTIDLSDHNKVVNTGHTTYGGKEKGDKGTQRDDIIPVSLGGRNDSSDNIRIQKGYGDGGNADKSDELEKQLAKDVKAGKISANQARLKIMELKNQQENPLPSQSVAKNFLPALGETVLWPFQKSAENKIDTQKQIIEATKPKPQQKPMEFKIGEGLPDKPTPQEDQKLKTNSDYLATFSDKLKQQRAAIEKLGTPKTKLQQDIYNSKVEAYNASLEKFKQDYKNFSIEYADYARRATFNKTAAQAAIIRSTQSAAADEAVREANGGNAMDFKKGVQDLVRAPVRGAAKITLDLFGGQEVEPIEMGKVFRLLTGDEKLQGYSRDAADDEAALKAKGFSDNWATFLAVGKATGSAALDLAPLYMPLVKGINTSIAERSGKSSITLSYKDLQDITSGKVTSGPKYDAFKAVADDVDIKQALKKGGIDINVAKDTLAKRASTENIFSKEGLKNLAGEGKAPVYSAKNPAPHSVAAVHPEDFPTRQIEGPTASKTAPESITTPKPIETPAKAPETPKTAIVAHETLVQDAAKSTSVQEFIDKHAPTSSLSKAELTDLYHEVRGKAPDMARVNELSKAATNSLENQPAGHKPTSLEMAHEDIKNGNIQPVRIRNLEDGSTIIEDGKHRLEAARQLGIKHFPIEDATNHAPANAPVQKYTRTLNLQDKGDVNYLEKMFSKEQVDKFKNGDFSHHRGGGKEYFEDIAHANIVSETPKTASQQLEGRITPHKLETTTVYHGTSPESARSISTHGFKVGSELPEDAFRGGGYGAMQNSISFSTDPQIAANFTGTGSRGALIEVKLKPDANVVTIKGIDYAEDLNDLVKQLRKDGIDAVYLEGEKEVAVINKKAIEKVVSTKEFDVYNRKSELADIGKKSEITTDSEVNQAPTTEGSKVSKAAKDINTEIVDKGFEALPDDLLAKYDPITKAETISKITDLITEHPENAKAMATGEMDVPANFSLADKQVLFNAIEEQATKAGDIKLLTELANSPIATERAIAAQTLGAVGFNKNPDSVVAKLAAIKKAKEARAAKKVKNQDLSAKRTQIKAEARDAIKKTNLTKEELSWEKFINDIKC